MFMELWCQGLLSAESIVVRCKKTRVLGISQGRGRPGQGRAGPPIMASPKRRKGRAGQGREGSQKSWWVMHQQLLLL